MNEIMISNHSDGASTLWDNISNTAKLEFGAITYRNWLGHLQFKSYTSDVLFLEAPTKFISQWIETNYVDSLITLCARLGCDVKEIVIEVNNNLSTLVSSNENKQLSDISKTTLNEQQCDIFNFNLDPKLTFENFVAGSSNRVAYSAAIAIAKGETESITSNILYIHGIVGQGKTHLLQSIASVLKSNSSKKIAYLSAEKFMHLYLKYMRANNLIGFKEKIKSCEIFLVDDLQFICGKTATQQEFSNLLSALTEANKLVVISSDINPFLLQLDNRSKSRLVGGFVVEITSSDYELRLQILKARQQFIKAKISDDVLEFIAQNITASNRELEGALNKLIVYANFEMSEVDLVLAKNLLKNNLEAAQVQINIENIINVSANYFNINSSDIISKSRSAKFILPRQISAYLAKQLTNNSLQDIGQAIGKRDHASIIYYIKQIKIKLTSDNNLKLIISEIEALIKNIV